MTLREIDELSHGYQERLDTEMNQLAWHAANVMNIHLKKKVTPKKLLGQDKDMTPLEREQEWTKLKEALAERRNKFANYNSKSPYQSRGPIQGC